MLFGSRFITKAEFVAIVTNMIIQETILRCHKDGGVADYFEIAAIGYSGDEASMLLGTPTTFVKSSALATANCGMITVERERLLPNGQTIVTNDRMKQWIVAKAEGNTPMRSALELAQSLVSRWCGRACNRDSYPPTIFNITDGEATDGDHKLLTDIAGDIKSLHTNDGNALLINIDISSTFCDQTILFPNDASELPGCRYANTLFEMSSLMPEEYNDVILNIKPEHKPPFRGMSFNTSAADLITMINIGSRSISKIL